MTQEEQPNNEILQKNLDQMGDYLKTEHSRNTIFLFFLFGVIIFIWKGSPFLSLGALVFFLGGMFLASILSIPSYLIKMWISRKVGLEKADTAKYFYWIFELVYNFFVTYLIFYLYTLIF